MTHMNPCPFCDGAVEEDDDGTPRCTECDREVTRLDSK